MNKKKHGARLKTNNLQWVSMLIIAQPLKETKTKCKEKQKKNSNRQIGEKDE